MSDESVETKKFPIYRKYAGIKVWFKIIDERNFIEIKQIGAKFIQHEVRAEQYPEIQRIKDMIECLDGHWEVIDESVYLSINGGGI